MAKFIDLTGQKFGKLTVISRSQNKNNRTMWKCICECGNETVVESDSLKRERTKSCGCLLKEKSAERVVKMNYKHGGNRTRLYRIWCAMKNRCYNENQKNYERYGARGITVCEEWIHDFKSFHDWAMSHGYTDELSIDRIDVNGNYEPSNCRWSTAKEQAKNRRKRSCYKKAV